jgi:hypothetical protein
MFGCTMETLYIILAEWRLLRKYLPNVMCVWALHYKTFCLILWTAIFDARSDTSGSLRQLFYSVLDPDSFGSVGLDPYPGDPLCLLHYRRCSEQFFLRIRSESRDPENSYPGTGSRGQKAPNPQHRIYHHKIWYLVWMQFVVTRVIDPDVGFCRRRGSRFPTLDSFNNT